jgi:hypothetical protein
VTIFSIKVRGTFNKNDLELLDQLSEQGVIPTGIYTDQVKVSRSAVFEQPQLDG